jgi:hypothetical protein
MLPWCTKGLYNCCPAQIINTHIAYSQNTLLDEDDTQITNVHNKQEENPTTSLNTCKRLKIIP